MRKKNIRFGIQSFSDQIKANILIEIRFTNTKAVYIILNYKVVLVFI